MHIFRLIDMFLYDELNFPLKALTTTTSASNEITEKEDMFTRGILYMIFLAAMLSNIFIDYSFRRL